MYVVGAVVIVILGVVAWTFLGMTTTHPTTSRAPEVLVPAGTYYTLPSGQFNSIEVIVNSTSMVNGTIDNTFGLALYLMTPSQLFEMAKSGNVSGYEWTSGRLADNTIYGIDLTLQPGTWDLVFLDPNTSPLIDNTAYAFYTSLTVTSA